jgi:hypothetical protein
MTTTAATRNVPRLTDRCPSVSVIIPMYNEAGFIEPCLRMFLAQTYPAELIEILVIDGGSDDGCVAQVEAMAATDSRIRLLHNPRRLAAAAANIGIEHAKGEALSASVDGMSTWASIVGHAPSDSRWPRRSGWRHRTALRPFAATSIRSAIPRS